MIKDPLVYLYHIRDAINSIESYTNGITAEQFAQTPLLQDAVCRRLEVIGEAANRLSSSVMVDYPEIPWAQIRGLRNRIVHEYDIVEVDIVWLVVERELLSLKAQIIKMIDDLEING